ncbi:hypothetical protein HYU89_00085 [Candidatus Collierbacteria bacterium]|nr:hypothetical protein [Candidatus Collierbacteria bacterium]
MENQPTPPQMNPPELTPAENKSKFLHYLPYVILPLLGGVVVFVAMNFYKPKETTTPTPTVNQKTQTPPVTETPLPITQPKAGDISVNWLSEPVKVNPLTIGLSVKDPNAWEGIKVDDLYAVYQVGAVTNAPFQNDKFYVIARACLGPCGSFYYRVVDDRGKQGLVLLANLSNEVDQSDKVFFVESSQYDIPALRFPAKLSVQRAGISLSFEAEDFSPATMFKDYIERGNWNQSTQKYTARNLKSDIRHPQYGILYEETDDGYFIARLPDGTLKLYRLQFPFSLSDDDKTGFLVQSAKLSLRLTNSDTFTANYTPISPRVCPPREYDVQKGIESKIKKSGTIDSAGDFYELSDSNDPMYTEIYQSFYNPNKISYATFLADHPFVFWKDVLGRWFRLRNAKFYPAVETECGYFDSVL